MADIAMLTDKDGNQKLPPTVAKAVYNGNERLDNRLKETPRYKDPLGTAPSTPRDADTLGGRTPEYYAKQNEVSEIKQNLTFDGDYNFRVGLDGDGNPGYYKADGSLTPFSGKMELLWTNPNPNSAQPNTPYDIVFDKESKYKKLIIEYKRDTTATPDLIYINTMLWDTAYKEIQYLESAGANATRRFNNATKNGITCYQTTNNTTNVPLRIWGCNDTPSNTTNGAELLWTNQSPSTSFAPQKISIDLTDYEAILITAQDSTFSDILPRISMYIEKDFSKVARLTATVDATGWSRTTRDITLVDDSGIYIGGGYANTTSDNRYIIPLKIYGLRNSLINE